MADDLWPIGVAASRYESIASAAAIDGSIFASFRRHPHYKAVLEHLSEAQGREYLDLIYDPLIRTICLESEYADSIGAPDLGDYFGRKLSPTTLRYGKVLQDIVDLFPNFRGIRSIVEIGAGYGGQARIVSEYVRRSGAAVEAYTLIDLPSALALSRRFLSHFSLAIKIDLLSPSSRARDWYDLAVSNFAFSEFARPLQQQYLDEVLLRSRCGYLTMNTGRAVLGAGSVYDPFCCTMDELVAALPNCRVLSEMPVTGPNNYVLAYGD